MKRALTVLVLGLTPTLSGAETADTTYRVLSDESRFTVEVGRAGLLKIFGHDHRIEVRKLEGRIEWNAESPETSRFVLEVDAASLTVADEELSEGDRASVQSDMETKALALSEHPVILFESTRVKVEKSDASGHRLKVAGNLSLRGVERGLEVPVNLSFDGDRLSATGELELESERWGVPQISAAGGAVKTKRELGLAFAIVAARD